MSKVKSCLLCENYNTHPCKCEHCEDWDNFHISESGKALREKIYGDGYQDGHRDGYDKGYDDAQANNNAKLNKPEITYAWQDSIPDVDNDYGKYAHTCPNCHTAQRNKSKFCPECGVKMNNA